MLIKIQINAQRLLDNMFKQQNNRNGQIHLYNPKQEGPGKYDFHYINAYKKHKETRNNHKIIHQGIAA